MGPRYGPGPTKSQKEIEALRQEFELDAAKALEKFRSEIKKRWRQITKSSIKTQTARKKYEDGVSFNPTEDGVEVKISGWFPNAMETGAGRFDMKPGLLAGRPWRDIPLENGPIRRVSVNSPSSSWWHPGLKPRKIKDKVIQEVPEIKQKVVAPIAQKYLGRMKV